MNETRRARRHAELPSEVLDIETAFGVEGNGAAPLMEPETSSTFALQCDDVVLTRLH
jgi:hypothetical protein